MNKENTLIRKNYTEKYKELESKYKELEAKYRELERIRI
jgi:hypothetical protein